METKTELSNLDKLESQSIFIIREAYSQFRNVAVLWSIGKDSTTMLWLVRKAFFGKIPFPVVHIDTTHKFGEIYDFRENVEINKILLCCYLKSLTKPWLFGS